MGLATTRGNIRVVLDGRGPVTLRPTDHIATGGEGSIYRVADLVVKLSLDPEKMRRQGVPEKVRKLSALLNHPYIVTPLGIVTTPSGDPVGHYLPYVEDAPVGHPLSRVFTNEFYQSEGFNAKLASTLVDRMRETVMFAHAKGALLIDPNELNWFALSVKHDPEPRIIDVDSWVVGSMPPTVAVMPSIRDWHASGFGHASDWFSWAVVTFQVYAGIHPYKGTLDGYARSDMETRMKDNASVFAPGVRLNRAVRDFSCIPPPLLEWYEAAFQKGERTVPPSPFDVRRAVARAVQVLRTVTAGQTGLLTFEKLLGYPGDPVVRVFHCGVALLSSGTLIDLFTKQQIAVARSMTCEVVKVSHGWLVGIIEKKEASFLYVREGGHDPETLQFRMRGHRLIAYEDRLFVAGENGLTEVRSNLFGQKLIASAGQTWGVIANSTKWFGGAGVFDAMGAKFVVAPFGDAAVAQVRVHELDGVQVVAGKAGNRFASFITLNKKGEYHKVELTFDREYRTYKAWTGDADGPELNIAILPKGVCATIVKDGELDIFVPGSGNVNRVADGRIATDMVLSNWGDKVVYVKDGELWAVRMK